MDPCFEDDHNAVVTSRFLTHTQQAGPQSLTLVGSDRFTPTGSLHAYAPTKPIRKAVGYGYCPPNLIAMRQMRHRSAHQKDTILTNSEVNSTHDGLSRKDLHHLEL